MDIQTESDLVAAVAKLKNSAPISPPVRTAGSLVCRVTVLNNTHPADNAVIVAAGTRYFFRGGKDETVGPYTLNLHGQESYTFSSTDSNGCVIRYFFALTCTIDGRPQNITFDWPAQDPHPPNLEPNKCVIQGGFSIGVRSAVAPGEPLLLEVFPLSSQAA